MCHEAGQRPRSWLPAWRSWPHRPGASGRVSASIIGAELSRSVTDAAGCECWCENIPLPAIKKLRVREARDPEAYVNFSASGMPLVRLVELFDDFFPGQILMPVSKMQEKVTTDEELRQIMLGDLGEYLGLVPVRTPLPGLATPPTDAEVRKPL